MLETRLRFGFWQQHPGSAGAVARGCGTIAGGQE